MTTARHAHVERRTAETQIVLDLLIDGEGRAQIETGLPFFDHMLTLFARHSLTDLTVQATGDLAVDSHHTVEDVGITLGQAFAQALGDKRGIARYGSVYVPMDETLARVVVDFSGRPFLEYRLPAEVGPAAGLQSGQGFSLQLVEEFCVGSASTRGRICTSKSCTGATRTISRKRSSRAWRKRWIRPAGAIRV